MNSFYFINHTRKEFIFFTSCIPITKALANAIDSSKGWSNDDDIRIGHDEAAIVYLEDNRYTISKNKI